MEGHVRSIAANLAIPTDRAANQRLNVRQIAQSPESKLIDKGNALFSESTDRNFLHHKSGDLRKLLKAISKYQKTQSTSDGQKIRDALEYWESNHPKEVKKRGGQINNLKKELDALGFHPSQQQQPMQVNSGSRVKATNLTKLLSFLESHYKEFACTDAVTYQGIVNKGTNPEKVWSNLKAFEGDRTRLNATEKALSTVVSESVNVKLGGKVSSKKLEEVERDLDMAKAGCCSTLAFSVANKLNASNSVKRVEIMEHHDNCHKLDSHLFVVINRAEDSDMANPNTWGNDAKIIDPWFATMQHGIDLPKELAAGGMHRPTGILFDSSR